MCRNEVLELLLFNLWGIELDVYPIFTEVEMELVWMHTRLSLLLMWPCFGCLLHAELLLFFLPIPVAINALLHELKSLQL